MQVLNSILYCRCNYTPPSNFKVPCLCHSFPFDPSWSCDTISPFLSRLASLFLQESSWCDLLHRSIQWKGQKTSDPSRRGPGLLLALMPLWRRAFSISFAITLPYYFHYPGSSTRGVQGSSALWQEVWRIQLWGACVGDVSLVCALHADGLGPGKILNNQLVFCTHFHESDKSQNGPAQILDQLVNNLRTNFCLCLLAWWFLNFSQIAIINRVVESAAKILKHSSTSSIQDSEGGGNGSPQVHCSRSAASTTVEFRPEVDRDRCPAEGRRLLRRCWASDPAVRPTFDNIIVEIQTVCLRQGLFLGMFQQKLWLFCLFLKLIYATLHIADCSIWIL